MKAVDSKQLEKALNTAVEKHAFSGAIRIWKQPQSISEHARDEKNRWTYRHV